MTANKMLALCEVMLPCPKLYIMYIKSDPLRIRGCAVQTASQDLLHLKQKTFQNVCYYFDFHFRLLQSLPHKKGLAFP